MFSKENNIKKIIEIKHGNLYKYNNLLLTPSLEDMISNYQINKKMEEKNTYQNNITSYIERKHELNIKKQYNPVIVNLYENGSIIINNNEYKLKEFYIVFNNNDYHIKCTNPNYQNKDYEYNKAVKFIDTTAFIDLINTNIIQNNKIIINDINILEEIIKKWDGYLHDKTKETDAIINKKMIGNDNNGR